MRERPYYTLAIREDGRWIAEFSDYDRATVVDERDDYRDRDYRLKDMRILKTAASDAAIREAITKLNTEVKAA